MISSDPQWEALRAYTCQMSGRKMPGERELAQHFGISRQRLRILLARLEAEGAVERRQGSGTYAVAPAGETALHQVALLVDAALKLGDDPFFSLLVERLQWALQAEGIRCVVERITENEARPRFLGDGALTVGLAGATVLSRLRPEDPPAVGLLTRPMESLRAGTRVSLLLTDDEGAGAAAAHLLLGEDCQRLLFVGRRDLPAAGERAAGAARAVAGQDTASLTTFDCGLNYRAGLAAGGRDNGAPGERPYHPGYYGAFLWDPDGNNIEAVNHGPASRSAASVEITPG